MATNLVSAVMQFLTPDMIAKIASVLGLDRNLAQKAISGAIPALLASFADVASTPNGARQLTNTLTQQSASIDSLKNLIGGSGQNLLQETGSNMLSGLFGGGTLDAMAQTIGKFAGIGEGTTKSMLGMLGPVVLSMLGQQQRSAGLDANGLASLLTSQKDQIAAAIPSGLAEQLSTAGLIDSATAGVRGAAAAGGRIAEASGRTAYQAGQAASAAARSTTASQWPYWLVAAVVLGGLAWFALGPSREDSVAQLPPASTTRTATGTVGAAPTDVTVGGMNLANQVNTSVGSIRTLLPGITDAASAEAALPKLKEATAQLNEVNSRAAQLSPEGKSVLVKLIVAATPTINQMCDKVLATPGAGTVAKPAIDELRGKLDALARS
ncbi:hypothetical protein CQ12_19705 [Bradyrhizobium jicamae]|uniref:DUF937 domain-containing protein n=1 Tax=Bradyrhizobium jicamae TaxID=280332 RepID=A0A0R3LZW7_9BRAD|nr:DUF937 domain-containing protein [Bradyrhizobium jicamae]KRR10691.1 hypothetical protein CQ12_19705 [Bradyrhizobium jicamae]